MLRIIHSRVTFCTWFCFIFFSFGIDAQQVNQEQERIDSLLVRLADPRSPAEQIQTLNELCRIFIRTDPEKTIQYGELALQLYQQNRLDPQPCLLRYIAYAYDRKGDYSKALEYLERAIPFLSKDDTMNYFRTVDYLAYLYLKNGEYLRAIEQYNQNLDAAGEAGMNTAITRAHAGLANAYRMVVDTGKEMFHLEKFLESAIEDSLKRDISIVEFRLGDFLLDGFEYEIALAHFRKALAIAEDLNDSSWMVSILNRIAWNHFVLNEPDSALSYYEQSLDLAVRLNLKAGMVNAYGNMGNLYRDRNDNERALTFYNQSLELARGDTDYYHLAWVSRDISELYAKLGEYKTAFEVYKQYKAYEDTMREQQYNNLLLEARSRYEADKAEKELEVMSLKLKTTRYFNYGLTGAILGILTIAILLVRHIRLSSKQRMETMNHTISEITQRNLRQQMNPHFIFNTLNSIQYYVFQNDKMASNNYLSKFSLLMRKTLDNSQHTSIPIKEELEALELYLELESLRFKGKFDWKITIDEEIDTLLYKIPTMLIQPYVENSIVHGLMYKENGKGSIRVDLVLENEYIRCTIDDNGIGREKAMEMKQRKNKDHQSLGTSITETRLKLISSIYGKRMNIQYSDKKDEDGRSTGTRVEIHIPIIT